MPFVIKLVDPNFWAYWGGKEWEPDWLLSKVYRSRQGGSKGLNSLKEPQAVLRYVTPYQACRIRRVQKVIKLRKSKG